MQAECEDEDSHEDPVLENTFEHIQLIVSQITSVELVKALHIDESLEHNREDNSFVSKAERKRWEGMLFFEFFIDVEGSVTIVGQVEDIFAPEK